MGFQEVLWDLGRVSGVYGAFVSLRDFREFSAFGAGLGTSTFLGTI